MVLEIGIVWVLSVTTACDIVLGIIQILYPEWSLTTLNGLTANLHNYAEPVIYIRYSNEDEYYAYVDYVNYVNFILQTVSSLGYL